MTTPKITAHISIKRHIFKKKSISVIVVCLIFTLLPAILCHMLLIFLVRNFLDIALTCVIILLSLLSCICALLFLPSKYKLKILNAMYNYVYFMF